MKIEVCVGSSCHVKGSHQIIYLLKNAIEKHQIADKIQLVGTTCIGQCKADGVNLKIDDNIITNITPINFDDFFNKNVLEKL